MNTIKKISCFLLIFVLFFSMLIFVSCTKNDNDNNNGSENNGSDSNDDQNENNQTQPKEVLNLSLGYRLTVAYNSLGSSDVTSGCNVIIKSFEDTYGYTPKLGTDESSSSIKKEIIIGNCERNEAQDLYSELEIYSWDELIVFSVKVVNSKIVIGGNNNEAVKIGCLWFVKNYLNKDSDGVPKDLSKTGFILPGGYTNNMDEVKIYTQDELNSLSVLNGILLDGKLIEDFSSESHQYTVKLERGARLPNITAKSIPGATVDIIQPTEANGLISSIKITSKDTRNQSDYKVKFEFENFNIPNVSIEKAKDGADAIVVIVHDDGDQETATFLSEEFEKNDLVGTLALVTSKFIKNGVKNESAIQFWQALLDTGRFNISSHTRTHSYWGRTDAGDTGTYYPVAENKDDIREYTTQPGRITDEVKGSQDDIKECFPTQRVLTFVKAGFGVNTDGSQITAEATEIIKKYYITMRNTGGGVETIPVANPLSVKSYMVRATDESSAWKSYVDSAIEKNGMIVFLFHVIKDEASGLTVSKTNASDLFKYVGEKKAANDVWVATFEDASLYTEEYRTAKATAIQTDAGIDLTLTDDCDNTIFNHALTVRVEIVEDWTEALQTNPDGTTEVLTVHNDDNGAFVYVNIVPDCGTVKLTNNK